ncbi:MAG TPA: PP2C family protein-serine/threonine phosphatase [Rhodothermales bacterium]|nr:PP2C family protein-serine/threonine phosphatase [Rhodothermales bacterium]
MITIPRTHPDAIADWHLGEGGAIQRAQTFLKQAGFSTTGFTPTAEFRRNTTLLSLIQWEKGRNESVTLLRQRPFNERFPAYYWRVSFRRSSENQIRSPLAEVFLTQSGHIWGLRQEAQGLEVVKGSDAGLISALKRIRQQQHALTSDQRRILMARLKGKEEATNRPLFYFSIPDTLTGETLTRTIASATSEIDLPRLLAGEPQPLDAAAAMTLAQAYLSTTVNKGISLQLDSLWVRNSVAHLQFSSKVPFNGLSQRTSVRLTQNAQLLSIRTTFLPTNPHRSVPNLRDGTAPITLIFGIIAIGLTLFYLFVFFRRISARILDIQSAIRDGLFVGGALTAMLAITLWHDATNPALPTEARLSIFLGIFFGGGAGALLMFMISGATDSMMYAVWPEKLRSLQLIRRLYVFNAIIGRTVLQAIAVAAVLLGLSGLYWWFFSGALMVFGGANPDQFLTNQVFSPFLYALFYATFNGVLFLQLLYAGVGSWLKPRVTTFWWFLLMGLILSTIPLFAGPIFPLYHNFLLFLLFSLATSWAFWHYDLLTIFLAYVLFLTAELLTPNWLAIAAPDRTEFLFFVSFVVFLLLYGVLALLKGRTDTALPTGTPAYLLEMANQKRVERELEIAHEVQQSFLPNNMPEMPGVALAALCKAAHETGGDYYEVIQLDEHRMGIAIGDVSGKGIQAAFYMTLIKGMLQTLMMEINDPAEVLCRVNRHFRRNARPGIFVSVVYGILDLEKHTFTFARAGHNPTLLKRSNSQIAESLRPNGIAIGMTSGPKFDALIETQTISLRTGDTIVLYTDGFSEAVNEQKTIFGDQQLAELVGQYAQKPPVELIQFLQEQVQSFVGAAGQRDDMTMLVFKLI